MLRRSLKSLACLNVLIAGLFITQQCDAEETQPLGIEYKDNQATKKPATLAYEHQIGDAVSTTWARFVKEQIKQRSATLYGTVVVHFAVDRRGKVVDPHVVSGDPKSALAKVSLRAVMASTPPMMPKTVIQELGSVPLTADFKFTLSPPGSQKLAPN